MSLVSHFTFQLEGGAQWLIMPFSSVGEWMPMVSHSTLFSWGWSPVIDHAVLFSWRVEANG